MRRWTGRRAVETFAAMAASVAILMIAGSAACAHDVRAWTKDRQDRFAAFKASHPPQEPAVASVMAKTEALVAASAPSSPRVADRPVVWRAEASPSVVFDVAVGPRMVVVPAGEFTMGDAAGGEPRRRVRIARAFAVGMFPITYGEYAFFVADTRRKSAAECVTLEAGRFAARKDRDWSNPGFDQSARSPAVCIGFEDATAYAAWLSAKSGQHYRLLSEAEYEYANRAGTGTAYWWGDDGNAGCGAANGFDQDAKPYAASLAASTCHDGHPFTAALDLSKPNPFGLYDTTGNVSSWTADCWRSRLAGASADGAANLTGDCRAHVVRGGSWADGPAGLRASSRAKAMVGETDARVGFRVARDL